MKLLRVLLARLSGLLPNVSKERDRAEEIEANLQLHVDDKIRQGMSSQEARRDAILKLGGFETTKEAYRDQSTFPLIENLLRDLRFALRQLGKNPGFTATAVLMLAVGICGSVAIFAFADAAFMKPLPYKDPAHLVGVYEKIEKVCPLCNLSYPDYLDWKRQNTVFSDFDVYNRQGSMLMTATGAQRAFATRVTDGFFRTLGVEPLVGRNFRTGEDQLSATRTVILSYAAWQKSYGGRPDVLGRSIVLNGDATVIIGVLPRDFHFAPSEPTDYWLTMHASSECDLRRSCHSLFGVARLKSGVTFPAALAEVTAIAARLEKQYPGSNREQGANLSPLTEVIFGSIRPILWVLLVGACLLLLIAAVNVTSLLLVRTEGRSREFAVRGGLGASAARITGQLVVEGLLLVAIGTGIGLVSAYWTVQVLTRLISEDALLRMPYLNGLGLNPRVAAFAGLIAFLAAMLFSFTPAINLFRVNTRQRLSEGSRGSSGNTWSRLGSKLVIVELSTAVVLLVGAGLLGQSLYCLLTVNLGLQPDDLVVMDIAAPPESDSNDERSIALVRKIIDDISSLAGVRSAAIATKSPVTYAGNTTWFKIIGRPWHGEHNDTPAVSVTPRYFQTIGATLLRGRDFNDFDNRSKPNVAIINEAFAHQFFPNEDPIGKRITPLSDPPAPIEITGLVHDIKEGPLDSETRPTLYYPFAQSTETYFSLVARTSGAKSAILSAMSTTIHSLDPKILTMRPHTMSAQIDDSQSAYLHRSLALLVGGFAAIALLLGVVGLYGVIAYSVSLRTREVGVRIALGAQPRAVYLLILKEAGVLIAVGLVVGVICSMGAARLMRSLLFGVTSWDAPTLISVVAILSLCGFTASFIPARRAAFMDPTTALRSE